MQELNHAEQFMPSEDFDEFRQVCSVTKIFSTALIELGFILNLKGRIELQGKKYFLRGHFYKKTNN